MARRLDGWDGGYASECRRLEEDAPALVAADLRVRHQVGELSPGRRLLVRQVARPGSTFNGKLLSTLPGERWLLRGTVCDDGTVTPADGTHRLQAGL